MNTYSTVLSVLTAILLIWFVYNLSRGRVKNLLKGSFRMTGFQRQFGYVTRADNPSAFWMSVVINTIIIIILIAAAMWMKSVNL